MSVEWIEWGGGERPVPPETRVHVRFRCGAEVFAESAGSWSWVHIQWTDGADPYDIVAYREVSE